MFQDETSARSRYQIAMRRVLNRLITQIKSDHCELMKSWNEDKNGYSNSERILRKIAWLKKEIDLFDRLNDEDIEGVCRTDIKKIRDDIQLIETKVKNI